MDFGTLEQSPNSPVRLADERATEAVAGEATSAALTRAFMGIGQGYLKACMPKN
jgi:hypothetical protein